MVAVDTNNDQSCQEDFVLYSIQRTVNVEYQSQLYVTSHLSFHEVAHLSLYFEIVTFTFSCQELVSTGYDSSELLILLIRNTYFVSFRIKSNLSI